MLIQRSTPRWRADAGVTRASMSVRDSGPQRAAGQWAGAATPAPTCGDVNEDRRRRGSGQGRGHWVWEHWGRSGGAGRGWRKRRGASRSRGSAKRHDARADSRRGRAARQLAGQHRRSTPCRVRERMPQGPRGGAAGCCLHLRAWRWSGRDQTSRPHGIRAVGAHQFIFATGEGNRVESGPFKPSLRRRMWRTRGSGHQYAEGKMREPPQTG